MQDLTEDEEIMAAIKLSMSANKDGANEILSEIAEIDSQAATGLNNLLAQQDSLKESQEEVVQKVIFFEFADSSHLKLVIWKSINWGLLQNKSNVQNPFLLMAFCFKLELSLSQSRLHTMQLSIGNFEVFYMLYAHDISYCRDQNVII